MPYIPYSQNILHSLSKVDLNKGKDSLPSNALDEDFYFQILVNDGNDDSFKLVYGTKKQLTEYLGLDDIDLPTTGVPVNENFVDIPIDSIFAPQNDEDATKNLSQNQNKSLIQNSIKAAKYVTVRALLQSRKISQIITSTWLDQKDIKTELTKKIFDTYPILPKDEDIDILPSGLDVDKIEEHKGLSSFIIRRDSITYHSIYLALLLSGQAYYKNDEKYELISDSIMSTYQIIWEFGFGLSWDIFYGYMKDIAEPGLNPAPPYSQVILPYPPQPNENSLKQKDIEEWAQAKDLVTEEESEGAKSGDSKYGNCKYPFYPVWNSKEKKWVGDELKFIAPAHSYITLTSL
ncbi:hypothetical protein [Okeania sp. SIO2B3]|uniref:hypothetical protein n=1 Tax=Okeania sp. SIO2B3 TaxID=2607784 RepID=UPI0013BF1712|nr:hypothetical protein [Okeania sp. SIO2B3]NET46291.1 hypothetical protein [Okeania sp. SIO2B3]